jgi:hypothetical protein
MPNWCNNTVELYHTDPAMIERVRKSFKEGALLQEFIPCPQELLDTVAGSFGTGPEQDALVLKEASNLTKYGHKNWYDWCVANWGTKWDVGANGDIAKDIPSGWVRAKSSDWEPTIEAFGLMITFESAWSPPIEAYARLEELGFGIKAFYYEPGMAFAGIWEDGEDNFYEYGGMNSEQVEEELPDELNKMFAISENIAAYEDEMNEE